MKNLLTLTLLFVFLMPASYAAHIISGTMGYTCQDDDQYEFKMILYRDCGGAGAPFDQEAFIAVYQEDSLFAFQAVPLLEQVAIVPAPYEDCGGNFVDYCTEKGTYVFNLTLPESSKSYHVVHQRCCWSGGVVNVDEPMTRGITVVSEITPLAQEVCNSSPAIEFPLAFGACPNVPIDLDLGGNELDGDSLVYELCMPFEGASFQNVHPNPPLPPPYEVLPFAVGFDLSNPFPTANGISFDSTTGALSFIPTTIGRFVFGLCVSEYRNGELLGKHRQSIMPVAQLEGMVSTAKELSNPSDQLTAFYAPGEGAIVIQRATLAAPQVQVMSIDGRLLLNQQFAENTEWKLPVAGLQAGLYLLRVREGEKEVIRKLMIFPNN